MAGGKAQADLQHLLRGVFRQQAREPVLTVNLLRQRWQEVVGPELGSKTQPQRVQGDLLWVATPDACWAYELQFFKPELVASVQAFLGSEAIRDLRFVVARGAAAALPPAAAQSTPAAPVVPDPALPPAGPAATPVPVGTPAALVRAAEQIGDPALRGVFQRSLAKMRRARAATEPGDER